MILSPTMDVPVIEQRVLQDNASKPPVSCGPLLELSELMLEEVTVGQARYCFKCPLKGRFDISDSSFRVDFFSPTIIGFNYMPSQARKDWETMFHVVFQELSALRPFEYTPKQIEIWNLMEKYVDIEAYHNSTPLMMTQIGRICEVTRTPYKYPKTITWLDNLRESVPPMNVIPDSFVTLKLGQYFEAKVERNRLTGEIQQIVDFKLLLKWEKSNDEIKALEEFLFSRPMAQDSSPISV